MPHPGQYATILGQLGAFLQAQGAQRIEITDEGVFLAVAWETTERRREHQYFTEEDLANLGGGSPWSGALPAQLSALGRELDRAEIEVARILQEGNSLSFCGVSHGRYVKSLYIPREFSHSSPVGHPLCSMPSALPMPRLGGAPANPGVDQKGSVAVMSASSGPLRRRLGLQ